MQSWREDFLLVSIYAAVVCVSLIFVWGRSDKKVGGVLKDSATVISLAARDAENVSYKCGLTSSAIGSVFSCRLPGGSDESTACTMFATWSRGLIYRFSEAFQRLGHVSDCNHRPGRDVTYCLVRHTCTPCPRKFQGQHLL